MVNFNSFKNGAKSTMKKVANEETSRIAKEGSKKVIKNFTEANGKTGASIAKSLTASAVSPAIGGAVIGAGINTVRGENAWDGAKKGAVIGGGYGVGKRAIRSGMGIHNKPNISTAEGFRDISKSVQSVMQVQKDAKVANSLKAQVNKRANSGASMVKSKRRVSSGYNNQVNGMGNMRPFI